MGQKLNSNSSAGTAADSDMKPIVIPSTDIAVNPMLYAALMKQRFEVIADYPGSHLYIGKVIDFDYGKTHYDSQNNFEKYPVIFRSLKWYEFRQINELPRFVKVVNNKPSYRLPNNSIRQCIWEECKNNYGFICDSFPIYLSVTDIEPATEEEYLSYVASLGTVLK